MPRHRVILLTLAGLFFLLAGYIATKDVRFRERDCGTALITSDPNQGALVTGNRIEDDFNQEVYSSECAHRILGQRLLVLVPAGIAVALWVTASRWNPKEKIPGDSVL